MMLLTEDENEFVSVCQAGDTAKDTGFHIPNELAESHHGVSCDQTNVTFCR